MKNFEYRGYGSRHRWLCLFAIITSLAGPVYAELYTIKAEYHNVLSVAGPNPAAEKSTSAMFFAGGYPSGLPVPDAEEPTFLAASSFGQPFARDLPYPTYKEDVLHKVCQMVEPYCNGEVNPGENPGEPAFEYKNRLFERETIDGQTVVSAQLHDMEDYWKTVTSYNTVTHETITTNVHRDKALEAAALVKEALRYLPTDQKLRRRLLDIYYDIAVADLALAQEKLNDARLVSLGIDPTTVDPVAGTFGELNDLLVISREITELTAARDRYQDTLRDYFALLQDPLGVDATMFDPTAPVGMPFGYYLVQQETPQRALTSTLKKNGNGTWVLPDEEDYTLLAEFEIFYGYKDLLLLFLIERDYISVTTQLAQRHFQRYLRVGDQFDDYDTAMEFIQNVPNAAEIEGLVLLDSLPAADKEVVCGAGSADLLKSAICGWRSALAELTGLNSHLEGETNLLGLPDDMLILVQSVKPGAESQYADSYDYFAQALNEPNTGSLNKAMTDLAEAKANYTIYRDRSDQLASQFYDKNIQYNQRLQQIVGAEPGTPDYQNPFDNAGSELSTQKLRIAQAQNQIDLVNQHMANIDAQIGIEAELLDTTTGIKNAMAQVYIDYGERQAALTEEIAAINANQAFWSGITGVVTQIFLPPTSGLAAGFHLNLAAGVSALTSAISGFVGASSETAKGELEAQKERLAAMQQAELIALEIQIDVAESLARTKRLLLEKKTLEIELIGAGYALQQELGLLEALLREQETLERYKAEENEGLADRYFASPAHRLLKDKSLLAAEYAFQDAQRWMFLTLQALEYKWNRPFDYSYLGNRYTSSTLLTARNAAELDKLRLAMDNWDNFLGVVDSNDDQTQKFSFKEDFFFCSEGNFLDCLKKEFNCSTASTQAEILACLDDYILEPDDPDNPLQGRRVLPLRFSTMAPHNAGLGFFQEGTYLDKIKTMQLVVWAVQFGSIVGSNTTIQGSLSYGEDGYVRLPFPKDVVEGKKIEWSTYNMRDWYVPENNNIWVAKEPYRKTIQFLILSAH